MPTHIIYQLRGAPQFLLVLLLTHGGLLLTHGGLFLELLHLTLHFGHFFLFFFLSFFFGHLWVRKAVKADTRTVFVICLHR